MASSTTHLDLISQSQAQKEATDNALSDAASPAMLYGRRASTSTGLTFGGYGGTGLVGTTPTIIANWTLALPASTTCYVRKLDSTGVVSFTTSLPGGWPAPSGGYTALYIVVTGAAAVTSYTDYRLSGVGTGTTAIVPSGTGFTHITAGAQDASAKLVDTADINANQITNAKLAQMAANTIRGNNTGSTANVLDLTATQVATLLAAFVGLLANVNVWAKNQSTAFVALTDGANIATDAALSNNFRVTLAGNRTLDNPTNLTDGMVLNWYIKQDATGTRTLAYGSKFKFFGGINTLSTTASAKDLISAVYTSTDDVILCNLVKAAA